MTGDYLTIKHVDNGFSLELNPFTTSNGVRRKHCVARNEEELYAVIKEMFPSGPSGSRQQETGEQENAAPGCFQVNQERTV